MTNSFVDFILNIEVFVFIGFLLWLYFKDFDAKR